MQSLLFIRIENRQEPIEISSVDVEAAEYLRGHTFHEIINIEQQATAEALHKNGRPSATLSVDRVTAASLSELFMFFELAVVYLAELLEVNAFDQPGVEAGKQLINQMLGKGQ